MAVISFLFRNKQRPKLSIPLNTLGSPFAFVYFTIAFCLWLFSDLDSRRTHRPCRGPRLENAGTKRLRPAMPGYLNTFREIEID
jgi:hypothetical protein